MTYKFAAMGVQVGGAKSGIVYDPRSPKKKEADAAFGRMAMPLLSTVYIIGEDMGTNAEDVSIIYNAAGVNPIEMARKKAKDRGITLNLPENVELSKLGGESFEEIITGYGIAEAADEAAHLLSLDLAGATVAVQGFGTVGSITARNLARRGARVIAVTDIEGTISNNDGLDVEKLIAAKDQHGTIDRSKLDFPFTRGGRGRVAYGRRPDRRAGGRGRRHQREERENGYRKADPRRRQHPDYAGCPGGADQEGDADHPGLHRQRRGGGRFRPRADRPVPGGEGLRGIFQADQGRRPLLGPGEAKRSRSPRGRPPLTWPTRTSRRGE